MATLSAAAAELGLLEVAGEEAEAEAAFSEGVEALGTIRVVAAVGEGREWKEREEVEEEGRVCSPSVARILDL